MSDRDVPVNGLSGSGTAVTVEVTDRSGTSGLDTGRLAMVASETLSGEGVESGELALVFVGADEMSDLNGSHMGKDGPTDVLAFPIDGPDVVDGALDGVPLFLGDVVICPEVAVAQAPSHCGSSDAELTLLVVHGVLHVLGHDHYLEDERLLMQGRERQHMARHGFSHPEPAP